MLLDKFIEVESKKRAAHAKQHKARLLIAKLGQLSRNVSFIFSLRNSEVGFVACDIPDANILTVISSA